MNGAGTWSIETGILTFFFDAQVVLGAVVAMETDLPTLERIQRRWQCGWYLGSTGTHLALRDEPE